MDTAQWNKEGDYSQLFLLQNFVIFVTVVVELVVDDDWFQNLRCKLMSGGCYHGSKTFALRLIVALKVYLIIIMGI